MALYINHNMPAMTAARNLSMMYSKLGQSIQRLSSGLRINSAADDAAGLAIREMMRSDIAVLNQGMRNASDAVSMIQTAEGALSVIDEKLIRMKELGEQAATGTYTTAQRDIMNSEYQAMAKEIDRIANATDFNGIKLLDGSISTLHDESGMKIHFGVGNNAANDYYFINMGDARATAATGLRVGGDAKNDIWGQGGVDGAGNPACCGGGMTSLDQAMKASGKVFSYGYDYNLTEQTDSSLNTPSYMGGMWQVTTSAKSLQDLISMVNNGTQSRVKISIDQTNLSAATFGSGQLNICLGNDEIIQFNSAGTVNTTYISTTGKSAFAIDVDSISNFACALATKINNSSNSYWAYYNSATAANSGTVYIFKKTGGNSDTLYACDIGYGGVTSAGSAMGANTASAVIWQNMSSYTSNSAGAYFANGGLMWGTLKPVNVNGTYGLSLNGLNVGDQYDLNILNVGSGASFDFKVTGTNELTTTNINGLGRSDFDEIQNAAWGAWAGAEIRTQSAAQNSLDALAAAILKKDKIRADLGAMQNRLQNTMTNLSIQAENLQAAESRISDVDVATEMTTFTKNNILTQAATSMLAQANSLAQLGLTLMGR